MRRRNSRETEKAEEDLQDPLEDSWSYFSLVAKNRQQKACSETAEDSFENIPEPAKTVPASLQTVPDSSRWPQEGPW
eukprot:6198666-Pyramimonas_sp.AAC.1